MVRQVILVFVTMALLARPPISVAQAGKRPRTTQNRRAFVPLDFQQIFTSGPLSDPQPPSTLLAAGALVADALHVFSAERYNDGLAVQRVTLEPMDGIILRRIETKSP